ncbi:MAG: replication initiator protein A [bacterium]|nr:replication initiator protein A [bacterium]
MEKEKPESPAETAVIVQSPEESQLPTVDFIKVEKNLASLGFFTPSSKRIKDAKAKTVNFTKIIDGKRIEAKVTIAPAAIYGLPITSDQDRYFAFQKILFDTQRQQGRVTNPIGFTSADILNLLHRYRDSGKNYKDIDAWLNVMSSTTIISEGAVYLAGRKALVKDRFHVFDRAVSFGKEIEPGKLADRNYVWLSGWQLENINNNYLLPIDLESYRQLENHIAKALVPLLQIWLYASREEGSFEKRYDELCEILQTRRYSYVSKIKEKLGPSLDELVSRGYLAKWGIEKTTDAQGYKIVFWHGEKFHRDRHQRLAQKDQAVQPQKKLSAARTTEGGETSRPTAPVQNTPVVQPQQPPGPPLDAELLAQLTRRGILETRARKLLEHIAEGQKIIDQLEWGDYLIAQAQPGSFRNPPGFYISLIRDNVIPPGTFENSRRRALREEREHAHQQWLFEEQQLRFDYDRYREEEKERYIRENLSEQRYQEVFQAKQQQFKRQYPRLPEQTITDMAHGAIRGELEPHIAFLGFEEWKNRRPQQSPVTAAEAAPATPEQGSGKAPQQNPPNGS